MGAELTHGLLMLVSKGTQNGVRHDAGTITAMHAMQQDVTSFLNQAADLFNRDQPGLNPLFIGPEITVNPRHGRSLWQEGRRMTAQRDHGVIIAERLAEIQQITERQ